LRRRIELLRLRVVSFSPTPPGHRRCTLESTLPAASESKSKARVAWDMQC